MKNNNNILVSACLLGTPCRWDGSSKKNDKLLAMFDRKQIVSVCPEVLAGLPTPRPACELCESNGKQLVLDKDGNNFTESFLLGAQKALDVAKSSGIKIAYLKSGSPSCGARTIYDGSFAGKKIAGSGMFAKMLSENDIEVIEVD
jgi:uncharacterized protein YbbK (DUF523 family)